MKWGIIGNGNVVQTKSGGAFKNKVIFQHDLGEDINSFVMAVDAVYIATPPDSHLRYARICAAHGKPTLCEKPMTRTLEEAGIMASLFSDTPLFVAYYRRCLPKFKKIKEIIESGAIGEIRFINIVHTLRPGNHPVAPVLKGQPLPWRYKKEVNGGGNFVDMGTHHLDLLDFFFGPVEVLHGEAANTGGLYETEDTVFASGVTA